MPEPKLSYWVCATPRSGSTALCNALTFTRVAGKPDEYLSPGNRERSLAYFGAQDYPELLAHVKARTQSENSVFGLKVMTGGYLEDLLQHIAAMYPRLESRGALASMFPKLRLVFLTRRNKVRQAVSHWRAIQSGIWHLPRDRQCQPPTVDAYRFEAVDTLVHDIVMREAHWQEFFEAHGLVPLTVVYEEFAQRPEGVVRKIAAFLELKLPDDWRLDQLPHQPIADEISEAWVQRYRAERQQNWERTIW